MRRVSVVVMVVAFAAVLVLSATARQSVAQTATPAADQGFVGAWRVDSETPFGASRSLITLMADGTVLFSDRPVLPGDAGFPDTFISAGHGAWEQTGPTTAAATWDQFVSDVEGNLLVTVTNTLEATLGADGISWSGSFSSTSTDPAGNVLYVGTGTVQATRITVQPLATPPAGTPAA